MGTHLSFIPIAASGDGDVTQSSLAARVRRVRTAHQGTNSSSLPSVLEDNDNILEPLHLLLFSRLRWTSVFSLVSQRLIVIMYFRTTANAHDVYSTTPSIFSAVKMGISEYGTKNITGSTHFLGGRRFLTAWIPVCLAVFSKCCHQSVGRGVPARPNS
ncbi:hypothetical protein C8Q70DRAFT_594507 [Cubamyces menziesii]|nr:hypothetical protein C8Q70DRAFT_594507 [Cubamyces menziesii]